MVMPRVILPKIEHITLNLGFSSDGHGLELFPRHVPRTTENLPGEISLIGYYSHKVSIPECIVPSGRYVGCEDAAYLGNCLVALNKTVRATSPMTGIPTLKPIPSIFRIDHEGRASQVAEMSGKLADQFCKGFTPLGHGLALIRRIYDEKGKENPQILLCRWNGLNSGSLDLQPVDVFLQGDPKIGIGISAPPIDTPEGLVLVYHTIWDSKGGKCYQHFPILLNKARPWEIIGISEAPIITPAMFSSSCNCWVGGATYIRNLLYDYKRDLLYTIVTARDIDNYWLEIPLTNILRGMRNYRNAELTSSAFSFYINYF